MEGCGLEGDQRPEESPRKHARADNPGEIPGQVKWYGGTEARSSAGKEPFAHIRALRNQGVCNRNYSRVVFLNSAVSR